MSTTCYSERYTVEDCLSISVFSLRKWYYFSGRMKGEVLWRNHAGDVQNTLGIQVSTVEGDSQSKNVWLKYAAIHNSTGEITILDYEIKLVSIPCHYGGNRNWFLCPTENCGKRVGILYLPPNETHFACRHCHHLTYQSCRDSHGYLYRFAHAFGMTEKKVKKLIREY